MAYSQSIIPGYDAYTHHGRQLIKNHLEQDSSWGDGSDGGVPLPDPRKLLAMDEAALRSDTPKIPPTIGILGAGLCLPSPSN